MKTGTLLDDLPGVGNGRAETFRDGFESDPQFASDPMRPQIQVQFQLWELISASKKV